MRFQIVYYTDRLLSHILIYYFNLYYRHLNEVLQSFHFNTQIKKNNNNSKPKFKERTFFVAESVTICIWHSHLMFVIIIRNVYSIYVYIYIQTLYAYNFISFYLAYIQSHLASTFSNFSRPTFFSLVMVVWSHYYLEPFETSQ